MALTLLHSPRSNDCQEVLFQEADNCKEDTSGFLSDEGKGMPAKRPAALQMAIKKHLERTQRQSKSSKAQWRG